jgi:hypothetical protein
MIGERTSEGWQLRLRARDPGRWPKAAFLALWLCGWAAGEVFAGYVLIGGLTALTTGTPNPGGEPPRPGATALFGLFLIVFIAFWTIGGIAALFELMRLLVGEDRLTVTGGRLIVERRRGPFRTARSFERDTIHRVLLAGRNDRLAIEGERGRVELSALGTREERSAAIAVLKTELALPESSTAAHPLPDRWEEIVTPEGERAVVPNLAIRRSLAWVAGVVTVMAGTVACLIARGIQREPVLVVPALLVSMLTLALGAGTVWLACGRMEWRIGSGRIVLRRRFGASARDVFEGHRLVLEETTDSDGDSWYDLGAIGAGKDEETPPPVMTGSPASRSRLRVWVRFGAENRRSIAKVMNDASGVRDLGHWLAAAAGIELEDRTTPEARGADVERLRSALKQAGPVSWTAKFEVKRSDTRRTG